MSKLNDLKTKYPEAFTTYENNRHAFPLFGFEIGEGWADLIEPVIKYIHEYNTGKIQDERITIEQIKEKFATLRFYVSSGNDDLYQLIGEAENKSSETCETCGEPGTTRGRGWIYTSCEAHAKDTDKKSS